MGQVASGEIIEYCLSARARGYGWMIDGRCADLAVDIEGGARILTSS